MTIDFKLSDTDRELLVGEIVAMLTAKLNINKAKEENGVMTVDGLAEYLQVSSDWVYKQVKANAIPVTRAGKNLRFLRGEIEKWLRSSTSQPFESNSATRKLWELRKRNEDCESSAYH